MPIKTARIFPGEENPLDFVLALSEILFPNRARSVLRRVLMRHAPRPGDKSKGRRRLEGYEK
jgi:hypothetical protein